MATIITALVADHRSFCAEFDRVERVLLKTRKLEHVKELARSVERMLVRHAAAEEDLLLLEVDQVPPDPQPRLDRFHGEHHEIDARLTRVHLAQTLHQARRLLQEAMATSRRHFTYEERTVFPLIEQVISTDRLTKLGAIWRLRNQKQGRGNAGAGLRQTRRAE